MTMPALPEIHAAYRAGFCSWRDFRLALRQGRFPRPDRVLPDGPRWDQDRLDRWLRGEQDTPEMSDEQELIERCQKI